MKRPHPDRPSDAETIEATAAAWLAQRDDGLTPEQTAEFGQWRSADVRHEAAVARLEAAWSALQQLREYRPEAARHPDRDLLHVGPAHRRPKPRVTLVAMAALAASLAVAAAWWFSDADRRTDSSRARYATTPNGYERVSLEDGSSVELNSESEVRVHFTPTERRVQLVRGEAHFTVRRNRTRPFLVEAGSVTVRAVGTVFNVRLGARDIEVLVTEGRVAVGPMKGGRADRPAVSREAAPAVGAAPALAAPALLAANERLVIPAVQGRSVGSVPAPTIEKLAPDAVRNALAWQERRLVFADSPLAEVVAQFNRRNRVQLVIADDELAALPVGGSFQVGNVEAFVRLLASGNDIAVERPDTARIVLRKAR